MRDGVISTAGKRCEDYIISGTPCLAAPSASMSTPHDLKNAGLKATLPRLKIINLFEQSPRCAI